MEKLITLLKTQQNYDDNKAEKKLNLFYHKANGAGITSFAEEYFEWLLLVKEMDYKTIMRMPDHELHEMYLNEFKQGLIDSVLNYRLSC